MTPEQVLAIAPRVLTQSQREAYFNDGFIILEKVVGDDWVKKLRNATDELVERSRKVTKSDAVWDLEPDHRADEPRLRRVSSPWSSIPCTGSTARNRSCPRLGSRGRIVGHPIRVCSHSTRRREQRAVHDHGLQPIRTANRSTCEICDHADGPRHRGDPAPLRRKHNSQWRNLGWPGHHLEIHRHLAPVHLVDLG